MGNWNLLTLRQRSAYFLALSEVVFSRWLSQSRDVVLARKAVELGWEGWSLGKVECLEFETIVMPPSEDGLYMAFLTSDTSAEQSAWRCVMDMVSYLGYYYCQSCGIDNVPQSIENVPSVDVKGDFDSYFDQAIAEGHKVRDEVIVKIAETEELTRDSIMVIASQAGV